MKFNGIEHFDRFEDGIIYWAEISDVPDAIQSKAQQIDGPAYNPNCFGLCVCYDTATNKFELVTDTDLSTGSSRNVYYIDNDGNKHWYKSDLAPAFIEQIFGACDRLVREIKPPIAGQIKDAQRPAGKHRGRTAPNKSARDKGNER